MKTYLRHRICNVIDIKELIALELLDFEGKYCDYEESHDFWEICYVKSGSLSLQADDKSFSLSEGQLILIPPNKKHRYHSAEGNRNQGFVICFDSFSQALDAISLTVFDSDQAQHTSMGLIMEESEKTFHMDEREQLAVLSSPRFGGQQALLLQLEYLIISLVRRMSVEKNSDIVFFSDENFYAELVSAILRYLRENLHKKITLTDVCEKFSYSRSFICKTFKNQTGESLITCFNRLKMEEAARLLSDTSASVTAVALSLGFREVKYFDTIFKKYSGLSPVQYRENTVKK